MIKEGQPGPWLPVQGVKDISFSNDGRTFLSSSYDKVVKLWDTETGKVLRSFGEGKMFFTARWALLHPLLKARNCSGHRDLISSMLAGSQSVCRAQEWKSEIV